MKCRAILSSLNPYETFKTFGTENSWKKTSLVTLSVFAVLAFGYLAVSVLRNRCSIEKKFPSLIPITCEIKKMIATSEERTSLFRSFQRGEETHLDIRIAKDVIRIELTDRTQSPFTINAHYITANDRQELQSDDVLTIRKLIFPTLPEIVSLFKEAIKKSSKDTLWANFAHHSPYQPQNPDGVRKEHAVPGSGDGTVFKTRTEDGRIWFLSDPTGSANDYELEQKNQSGASTYEILDTLPPLHKIELSSVDSAAIMKLIREKLS